MRTAFATVIYKQAREYLEDFLKSLDVQTDKDFDLLLVNDNYSDLELDEIQKILDSMTISYRILDISQQRLSIAGTRIEMLGCAKDLGYDLVILGDADDTFSIDRVEKFKNAYKKNRNATFFYNKLVFDNGKDVFNTIPKQIDNIKNISQCNFVGLTSSAINLNSDIITQEFIDSLKESDSPVFDWYLFSRIVLEKGVGVYVEDATSIYRISDNNMVGVSRDVKKEYDVKIVHYSNLAKKDKYYKKLLEKLEGLDINKLTENPNHQGYWWSDIQMEE
ncbi:Glycosyl transferase family 2 [Pseudobutyrivibrio sp. UC1225]|uniref:glycosyltransferase n=1 Tax=Pseudobutyrivibrio sp. UC1225 TaxID=1798185 RepID=UPI0008EBE0AD|nr:glycosyltransferase [Pseudobutyrivibrio sp. UC1225]SFN77535.1 Glycosyl transferase family 2 [Pseudobutyrivibrio sp. UC1225]